MGGFAGLPQAPQFQMPQFQGQSGGMAPPNPGLMQYQPSFPASIVGGVNDFVSNYLNTKQQVQEHWKQKFMQGVQDKMLGLNVNDEELMKYAKRANLPLRTEPYTPVEQAYQQAQSDYQKKQQSAQQMVQQGPTPGMAPGSDQIAAQFLMQGQPPQAPSPQPHQQPGVMQRIGNALNPFAGQRAQVSTNSPTGDWLRQLSQSVQIGGGLPGQIARQGQADVNQGQIGNMQTQLQKNLGIPLQGMGMQQQMALLDLTKQAYSGNPQAVETLTRSGIFKDLPGDDISRFMSQAMPGQDPAKISQATGQLLLWMNGGGPQMQAFQQQLTKDLLPHFNNDLAKAWSYVSNPNSGLKPGYTPDEQEKVWNTFNKLQEAFPQAPASLLSQAVDASMTGNDSLKNQVMGVLSSHYKTKSAQELGQGQQRIGIDQGNLQVNQGSLAQRTDNERSLYNLQVMKAITDAAGGEAKSAYEDSRRPDATAEQIQRDMDIVASATNKLSKVDITYGGHTYTIADPVQRVNEWRASPGWLGTGGKPEIQQMKPPDQFWGQPGQMAQPPTQGMGGMPPQQQAPSPQMQSPLQVQPPAAVMKRSLQGLSQGEQMLLLRQAGIPDSTIQQLLQMGLPVNESAQDIADSFKNLGGTGGR